MEPITAAKLWLLIKPIKRLKQRRARKKAEKLDELNVVDMTQHDITDEQVEAEVKEFLVKKAIGATKSTTVGVIGAGTAVATWLQANPDVWNAIPDLWQSGLVIGYGVLLFIARSRTLGK